MHEAEAQCSPAVDELRRCVLNDAVLLEQLRATRTTKEFISLCIAEGQRLGLALSAEELDAALRQARREWIERWT